MGVKNIQHCHTMYSLNDSALTPHDLVKRAKELGAENIALTDHGTLLGVNRFMEAGEEFGVNTIPGVEAYIENRAHLILIPRNYEGFQSISYAMRDANNYMAFLMEVEKAKGAKKAKGVPIMTDEILKKYFEGNRSVIATSACIQGPVASILLRSRNDKRSRKLNAIMESTVESHDAYLQYKRRKTENAAKLKEYRSYRTQQSKFQKPAHKTKMDRLKNNLETMNTNDPKRMKVEEQLRSAENEYKMSAELLPGIEKTIENLQAEKNEIAEAIKLLTGDYKKFEKAKESISGLPVYNDADLYKEAKERLILLKSIFPNFYIEVQNHGLSNEAFVMPLLVQLAKETETPLIAANDAHMADDSEDAIEARRVMRFAYFEKAQTTSDADRELYLKTDEELSAALLKVIDESAVSEAMHNLSVLEDCKVVFPHESHYPKVKTGATLDKLIEKKKRENEELWTPEVQERIDYELGVIKSMGYEDYHLVVEDFCRVGRLMGYVPKDKRNEIPDHFSDLEEWVTKNGFREGIGIGPGRGSAAGSKVCNVVGITNIDPIKYDLLFERFLNPERVSMPDIDTDCATSIRPYLIMYLKWRYGEQAVCFISTENTYGAKGALRMAGRDRADQLFGHLPKSESTERKAKYNRENTYTLIDMISDDSNESLSQHDLDFAQKYGSDSEKCIIWHNAKLVEGKLFTTGVHAGGVIISDNDNINDYVPLAWNDEKGVWVAQCDMIQAEEKGLLKMDLLGLGTLDCISDTVHLIKRYRGIDIDMDKIPFEREVFDNIYAKGFTNSVFQVESAGMKNMLMQFKPTCFEDIILLVAAYRPGPMQYLDDIIAVKNGKKPLTYKHEKLEPILSTTYGATIYQEQVMRIFQNLAGYSLGGADLVRRAMSKKNLKKLEHERDAFIHGDTDRKIDGCVKRGITETLANQLFDEMMDFARYAFNKSHATAYAYVSYQTAWLKYHYPVEFLCAMFNNKEQKKYGPLLDDCRSLQIKLLPPDVNCSFYDFVVEGNAIRFGMRGIKGIGEAMIPFVQQICDNRSASQYTSFQDFLKRNVVIDEESATLPAQFTLATMINAGMFDSFDYNRESLICAITDEKIIVERTSKDITYSDREMMAEMNRRIDALEIINDCASREYNMMQEQELLGFIVSSNPFDRYGDDSVYGCVKIEDMGNSSNVSILGFITSSVRRKSKNGKDMLVLDISGRSGSCTGYVIGKAMEQYVSDMDSYLYKVVRIAGSCKDGKTIFITSIHYMPPEIRPTFIMPQSESEIQEIMSVKGVSETAYAPVYTLHGWNKNGKPFRTKVSSRSTFSPSELKTIKGLTMVRDDIY